MDYLKATGLQVCLLFNFGNSRLKIRRFALGLRSGTNHLR